MHTQREDAGALGRQQAGTSSNLAESRFPSAYSRPTCILRFSRSGFRCPVQIFLHEKISQKRTVWIEQGVSNFSCTLSIVSDDNILNEFVQPVQNAGDCHMNAFKARLSWDVVETHINIFTQFQNNLSFGSIDCTYDKFWRWLTSELFVLTLSRSPVSSWENWSIDSGNCIDRFVTFAHNYTDHTVEPHWILITLSFTAWHQRCRFKTKCHWWCIYNVTIHWQCIQITRTTVYQITRKPIFISFMFCMLSTGSFCWSILPISWLNQVNFKFSIGY